MSKQEENIINQLYSSTQFQTLGHQLIDLLTNYLQTNIEGKDRVINWKAPSVAHQDWQKPLPQEPSLDHQALLEMLEHHVLADNLHIHHPRNMGHQVAPPLPVAALCELVSALTNQAMAVYETGPSATMLERQVIQWLGELITWKDCSGVLTSGGAQANLTALLAARQSMAGWDVWQQGISAGKPLCILVSEHSHYSISRSAGIMGLGTDAVIKIATDKQGSIDVGALKQSWLLATQAGKQVLAVVATAGCTPTGSIDPLNDIAEFCQNKKIWLHVDGAHGASALLSSTHRNKLNGISQADSIVWDGHKLLYMPAAVSAVLFKNPAHSYAAFAQEASYLFQGNSHADEAYNTSYRTLECTKRMMGLKLWVAFSLYGVEQLGSLVNKVFATAHQLAEKVNEAEDFELAMIPQTNIVCFRYLKQNQADDNAINQHQIKIRNELVQSGAFHITQTTLTGKVWLRTAIMNPYTSEKDLNDLLSSISKASCK